MAEQTFTITVNVKELLTEFIPKLAKEYVQMRGSQEELKGTELTLTLDISGAVYSFIIKDGINFEVKEGALDNPRVRIALPLEAIAKMADMKNIDMLIGMQSQLTRKKYDVLTGLKGTSVFHIKNPDGTVSDIAVTFNGAQAPKVGLSLSMEDANLINRGQENPIQLFMSGRMQIDGEMAFAMMLQPLFLP
ncbi:MAG: SCP2 sterol-binding domain-containing protein [Thermodesulfobacteriota bacterium]